jgi:hypothetical protein
MYIPELVRVACDESGGKEREKCRGEERQQTAAATARREKHHRRRREERHGEGDVKLAREN